MEDEQGQENLKAMIKMIVDCLWRNLIVKNQKKKKMMINNKKMMRLILALKIVKI